MDKNTIVLGALVLLVLIIGGYFIARGRVNIPIVSTPVPTATPRVVTVKLDELGNSKESGTATLTESGDKVVVRLELNGAPANILQPAHIHKGNCPGVGGIVHSLSYPLNGKSETTINTTLDNLFSKLPLAINIHKSESEGKIYYSCGNLTR